MGKNKASIIHLVPPISLGLRSEVNILHKLIQARACLLSATADQILNICFWVEKIFEDGQFDRYNSQIYRQHVNIMS